MESHTESELSTLTSHIIIRSLNDVTDILVDEMNTSDNIHENRNNIIKRLLARAFFEMSTSLRIKFEVLHSHAGSRGDKSINPLNTP